jgi:arylsulfatase A-like enzyme
VAQGLRLPIASLVLLAIGVSLVAGCAPEPPRQGILILLDAARADRLSSYGYGRETTPHLDALGADGVVFLKHFTQGVNTRTAMPTILYSRYYSRPLFPASDVVPYSDPKELFRGPDSAAVSLPRALAGAGFHTALVSAHAWLQPGTLFGSEFEELRPLREVRAHGAEGSPSALEERRYFYPRADQMVSYAIDWIDRHADESFFLYLHFMDTHTPHFLEEDARRFLSPADLARVDPTRFLPSGDGPRDPSLALSEAERRYLDALYDGSLRYVDRELGRLFTHLRRSGSLERTLIVVTSDHGENLVETPGRYGHAGEWNDIVARVPLILFYPPKLGPARVGALTEGVDLLPTILSLWEVPLPAGKRADGVDLVQMLRGGTPSRQHVFMRNAARGLRYKCVFGSEDAVLAADSTPESESLSAQLYDLSADPLEIRNLWGVEVAEAEHCLGTFRRKMQPLHREYTTARSGEQPHVPFAIAATYFRTEPELPPSRASRIEELVTEADGHWVRSEDWRNFFLLAGAGASELRIEFELPNGSYRLSAGVLGSGTLRLPHAEGELRVEGPPLAEAGWFGGTDASGLDWRDAPVDLGMIEITDERFRAGLRPDPQGSPLVLRRFGFTPITEPGGAPPERDEELMERLRGLGYVR